MPTYSYRCTSCQHAFDIHQSFSDATLTVCEQCGGALRKVFSPVGISFKGSGFYHTDHGAAAPAKASTASAASGGGGESSSGSSSTTTSTSTAGSGSSTAASTSSTPAAAKA